MPPGIQALRTPMIVAIALHAAGMHHNKLLWCRLVGNGCRLVQECIPYGCRLVSIVWKTRIRCVKTEPVLLASGHRGVPLKVKGPLHYGMPRLDLVAAESNERCCVCRVHMGPGYRLVCLAVYLDNHSSPACVQVVKPHLLSRESLCTLTLHQSC